MPLKLSLSFFQSLFTFPCLGHYSCLLADCSPSIRTTHYNVRTHSGGLACYLVHGVAGIPVSVAELWGAASRSDVACAEKEEVINHQKNGFQIFGLSNHYHAFGSLASQPADQPVGWEKHTLIARARGERNTQTDRQLGEKLSNFYHYTTYLLLQSVYKQ